MGVHALMICINEIIHVYIDVLTSIYLCKCVFIIFRFVDFEGDGHMDLLAASGGGIYYLKNNGDGRFIKDGYLKDTSGADMVNPCSMCNELTYIDINGDGIKDIITKTQDKLIYYPGVGGNINPKFGRSIIIPLRGYVNIKRMDLADMDHDGLLDVIVGRFLGNFYYFRNVGDAKNPLLSGESVKLSGTRGIVAQAYNTHPRVKDFNQDGLPDILYGINWSYLRVYINSSNRYNMYNLKNIDGVDIDLRAYLGDNTDPDVGDVNNDGVVDLVTSGNKGKVVILLGALSYKSAMAEAAKTMALHPEDLGTAMQSDNVLWNKMYDLHRIIQTAVVKGALTAPEKHAIFLWYRGLVIRYPNYLTRQQFSQPHLDCLAAYHWVIMLEAGGDTPTSRADIASITKQTGTYATLLINQGIFLVDNNRAYPRNVILLQRYMETLNPKYYSLEDITIKEYLTSPSGKYLPMIKSGVNIFAGLRWPTNQFPKNCEICKEADRKPKAMVFLVVLAHEVAHNSLDQPKAPAYRQALKDRKYELIHRTAGPEIIWSSAIWYDVDKTKDNFRAKGWWDGKEDWNSAMERYYKGPGAKYDMNHLRQMYTIDFFIRAPQEAFATLANQYFDISKLMLDYAWEKALKGYILNVDWFLLCAEYYSLGTNTVPFWSIDGEGNILTYNVTVGRSSGGYINKIMIPGELKQPGKQVYELQVDEEDDGFIKAIM